mgnify:CR=1 FL=1
MILNLAAFFIIPGYTLLFIRNFNLFSLNFSVIGNMLGRKRGFCLWGMMTGWYFFWVLSRVSAHLKLSRGVRYLVHTALFLLCFAGTTPYRPEELPVKAFLHIVLPPPCACASICFSPPGGCERRTGQPDWLRCGVWQAFSSCLPFC